MNRKQIKSVVKLVNNRKKLSKMNSMTLKLRIVLLALIGVIAIKNVQAQQVIGTYFVSDVSNPTGSASVLDGGFLTAPAGATQISMPILVVVVNNGSQPISVGDTVFFRYSFNNGTPDQSVRIAASFVTNVSDTFLCLFGVTINVNTIIQGTNANKLCIDIPFIRYSGVKTPVSKTPDCSSFTITMNVNKQAGADVGVPTLNSKTATSITINPVTPPSNGQTVEYTISTTPSIDTSSVWQSGLTFTGLSSNTSYCIVARSAENASYYAGKFYYYLPVTTDLILVDTIINLPTTATMNVPLTLTGTVMPSDASYKDITWSLVYPGTTNASIVSGVLYTSANGTAIIKATIANGKGTGVNYTQDFNVVVGGVGIAETDNYPSLQVFPNPANTQLRVSGEILDGKDREIRIFNVVGQVVFTSQLSKLSPETTIDISPLANGLYFLKVDGKMVKVVKE